MKQIRNVMSFFPDHTRAGPVSIGPWVAEILVQKRTRFFPFLNKSSDPLGATRQRSVPPERDCGAP